MAGRALRLFDVPVALGFVIVGHLAIGQAFGETAQGGSFAERAAPLALMGGLGAAILGFLSAYYHDAQPLGAALRRAAAGFAIGAVVAVAWSLAAGSPSPGP